MTSLSRGPLSLLVLSLTVVLSWPALSSAQNHEVATQSAVMIAMRNPWPKLPAPEQINEAFDEFKAKLGTNTTIASGPTRMYVPWETIPLLANKVVLTTHTSYSSQPSVDRAVVLKYDFLASKFKFEGLMLPGIKRYAGDKNTASFLEPQDLKYLKDGWLAYNPVVGKAPGPDDVADLVEEYIRQFERDTCFGRVIKLGDSALFRKALRKNLTVVSESKQLGKDAKASHMDFYQSWAVTPPPAEMHAPFVIPMRPTPGQVSGDHLKSLYHESVHHIEYLNGLKRKKGTAGSERNTDYLDFLVGALHQWKKYENDVITGKRTAAQAKLTYGILVAAFKNLQDSFEPDLDKLKTLAGIDISLEKIRALYLSGNCPNGQALHDVVMNYAPGDEEPMAQTGSDDESHPAPAAQIQHPSTSHLVYAMVSDKATGKPVNAAAFTVLQPGVSTARWIASGYDMALVAAMGVSDAAGMVTLDKSLHNGKTYSLMVVGPSYMPVRYEALVITAQSQEPLKISVKLQRR